jgi:hypothetical protein
MSRLQQILREPAWIIQLVETGLLMLVAFGLGLTGDQQSYIVAAVVAGCGLLTAFFTRPFAVAALTDFARAALVLFASFGVGLSADQIALVVSFLGILTTGVVRGQVTPDYAPRGEAGVLAALTPRTTLAVITVTGIVLLLAYVFTRQ